MNIWVPLFIYTPYIYYKKKKKILKESIVPVAEMLLGYFP